ncbi:hypothetical protein [Fredinandcohnia sp. 179-A 10B2 NHS]|uniref:hypothetical protein n=1 Tax=Fredinandcohnia sp. 179-A 10B2 NHS TaxID=3235176 RepID=UPI0039A1A7EC
MKHNRQRVGGVFAIFSAVLLVIVMASTQTLAMKDVSGDDVYELTVNSLATYPVLNWGLMIAGAIGMILMFWTVEALDERIRTFHQTASSNVSRFGYIHLITYTLYMLMPFSILHDLVNEDKNVSDALTIVNPIMEISLVLSIVSCIFLGLWLLQLGLVSVKTKALSKPLGIFTIVIGGIVLVSAGYEALYGRGSVLGIILSMLTFAGAFVVWKVWVGVEMLRR